jgi:predicted PurR-regulated permease PerM
MLNQKTFFWIFIALILGFFTYLVSSILLPFIVGILMAYLLDPATDKLEETGFGRTTSTVIILTLFIMIFVVAIVALVPLAIDQFQNLAINFPLYVQKLNTQYGENVTSIISHYVPDVKLRLQEFATKFSTQILQHTAQFLGGVWNSSLAIFNIVSLIFLTPVVAFYLIRDWDKLVAKIHDLLPQKSAPVVKQQMKKIDEIISAYLRGQLSVCVILGLFYAIGLAIVGLNHGFFIGFLTGILSFIPFVGCAIGTVITLIVAYIQFGDLVSIGFVALVFVIGQVLEGNIITPKLVGDKVNLHPLWVIFALLAGGTIFGFIGVLIAIPAAAVIGVLVRFSIEEYKKSGFYKKKSK